MPFPHRINCDGTIDSICDQCFATVGTSSSELELASLEAVHACEPARIAYYKEINEFTKRPPESHRSDEMSTESDILHKLRSG